VARKKNTTRRSRHKFASLDPRFNLKSRAELLDFDYLHKLSEKEKEWLAKFSEEYISASFNTKSPRKNLHKNKALRKSVYDANNARNRDILTRAKASGNCYYIDEVFRSEDALNEVLSEELLNKSKEGDKY
jgi:hypothetical protein